MGKHKVLRPADPAAPHPITQGTRETKTETYEAKNTDINKKQMKQRRRKACQHLRLIIWSFEWLKTTTMWGSVRWNGLMYLYPKLFNISQNQIQKKRASWTYTPKLNNTRKTVAYVFDVEIYCDRPISLKDVSSGEIRCKRDYGEDKRCEMNYGEDRRCERDFGEDVKIVAAYEDHIGVHLWLGCQDRF